MMCAIQCEWIRHLHEFFLQLCLQDEAVAHCWELPPHTFGGAYAQFMGTRGFKADDRPVVRCVL